MTTLSFAFLCNTRSPFITKDDWLIACFYNGVKCQYGEKATIKASHLLRHEPPLHWQISSDQIVCTVALASGSHGSYWPDLKTWEVFYFKSKLCSQWVWKVLHMELPGQQRGMVPKEKLSSSEISKCALCHMSWGNTDSLNGDTTASEICDLTVSKYSSSH